MSVISLFHKSNNAKHAGPKQVLNEAIDAVNNGSMGDKLIVVSLKPNSNDVETVFIQSGMSAVELISLLELAKLNVYMNYMKTEKIK